ncbi:hypothetical protein KXW98_000208 [Aspergillus fumigatus]|uniref:Carrier domain-containing protein n=1 Tax=Aspergillus fumigatus TaxID=746128 RepID=A0A9P8SS29_ASPFM|nr:hypothetical protein KXX45_006582 [Aspergillus fumigatus]KAH1285192.1 hypothetical protein KXX48_001288 [Aspergillus fumigatus]KAH1308096.1 hypothetical protein KXX66_001907 [Aspergillus fumigatus]KAH1318301.1 hypothetical protein KXX47_002493 [Aspergillus fumigatus]KAH1326479.1 hypothetical protein KXX38_005896 [Aspergillus fumigatus]
MEASTTDMSDAFWVQDSRLESLRANLASLASETDSVARGRSAQGGRDGGAQWATPSASLISSQHTSRVEPHEYWACSPRSSRLDGVSVARHGVDSMISVELQTWMYKEFGVQIGVQFLSDPSTTFRSLASLVAEHLHVAA